MFHVKLFLSNIQNVSCEIISTVILLSITYIWNMAHYIPGIFYRKMCDEQSSSECFHMKQNILLCFFEYFLFIFYT